VKVTKTVHVSLQAAPQVWSSLAVVHVFKSEPSRPAKVKKENLTPSISNCQGLNFIHEFQMLYPFKDFR